MVGMILVEGTYLVGKVLVEGTYLLGMVLVRVPTWWVWSWWWISCL